VWRFFCCLTIIAGCGYSQDLEDFRVELTLHGWLRNTSGTIQSGLLPVDLRSDLFIDQPHGQFQGRLVFKPTRRNRLFIEGTPYMLNGDHAISRQITFAGRTYEFQDQVRSSADIEFVMGGYQFDVIERGSGHFGLQAGAAYVNASGTLRSVLHGLSGTETQTFGLPMVGGEGRAAIRWFTVSGYVRGMPLGTYGHYFEVEADGGINLGRHVTVQGGYHLMDADIRSHGGTRGFAPRFEGPVFGVQLRM